jgi:hypothetical protein
MQLDALVVVGVGAEKLIFRQTKGHQLVPLLPRSPHRGAEASIIQSNTFIKALCSPTTKQILHKTKQEDVSYQTTGVKSVVATMEDTIQSVET